MIDLNQIISIITLNTNGLNIPIKRASKKNLQVISYLIFKDLMLSSELIYFKLIFVHQKCSLENELTSHKLGEDIFKAHKH